MGNYFVRPDALKSEFVETENSVVKILEVDIKNKAQQINHFFG